MEGGADTGRGTGLHASPGRVCRRLAQRGHGEGAPPSPCSHEEPWEGWGARPGALLSAPRPAPASGPARVTSLLSLPTRTQETARRDAGGVCVESKRAQGEDMVGKELGRRDVLSEIPVVTALEATVPLFG